MDHKQWDNCKTRPVQIDGGIDNFINLKGKYTQSVVETPNVDSTTGLHRWELL